MAKRTAEELEVAVKEWNRSQLKVSMRQARLALYNQGLLESVDTQIATLDEPARTLAGIEWRHSDTIERVSPLVATVGTALNLSDEQLDSLFELAATL